MIVGLGIVRAALMAGRRLISGRQALDVEMDMRSGLYAHLVRLSFGFYDRHQTGQLMSRATVDLQGVRFFLGYGLIFFFQNVLTVVSVTVVLFFVEWRLALIVLAVTPLLVALAYRYSHVAHPTLRDVQQRLADVATVAEENIVGVHVVKAFAQEPAEQAKFTRRSEARLPADAAREPPARDLRAAHLVRAAARAGGGAARRRAHGRARLADAGQLRRVQPLPRHARRCRCARSACGSARRSARPRRASASSRSSTSRRRSPTRRAQRRCPPGRGAIRFEHVIVRVPARTGRCCADVDLDIAPGTTIALIGHTGSGKTTLTSLVPRFYDVTGGRVTLDGVDVRDVTLASLRREIGVISQDPFLFSASVRDNIAFGRGDLPRRGGRARRARGAGARVHRAAAEGLRHGDRRARDHALGRPAAAHRDRPRARRRPAHPHPRRRDGLRRRDDRGAASASASARRRATGRR